MKNNLFKFCLAAALAVGLASNSQAEMSYPSKPITIVVGFAAGGLNDILARMVAKHLSTAMHQPVVVENKPGAAANIAAEYVVRSKPDGYTLLLSSSALAINPAVMGKLRYDLLKDLAPIIRITTTKMLIMVNPKLPVTTLAELIALAKSKPGKLDYASSGPGGPTHLATELFKYVAGVDITHIPYKGSNPATMAALAGEIDVMVDVIASSNIPYVKSGQLKALAVTGETRSPLFPDIPTAASLGVNIVATSWNGILAPAGTPKNIIDRLNEEIRKAVQSPEIKEQLLAMGAEVEASSPEEFSSFMREQTEKWAQVVQATGIKAD